MSKTVHVMLQKQTFKKEGSERWAVIRSWDAANEDEFLSALEEAIEAKKKFLPDELPRIRYHCKMGSSLISEYARGHEAALNWLA